jgi:hypothetical protein
MTHWGRKPRKPRTLVVVLLWGSMRRMMRISCPTAGKYICPSCFRVAKQFTAMDSTKDGNQKMLQNGLKPRMEEK